MVVRNLFELEDYFNPIRVNRFYSNNYIECESNGDKNKTLLSKEYLEEIKQYFKNVINLSISRN